ncbi:MAG TPA: tetratricopeptide repeat protein [Candidatus Acidoferrum sp.]|nr:tetratricopeptide repeat protein [Candidatus Acidoferrum sp.]
MPLDDAAQSANQAKEPSFDKLELFAFFAAGPINSYASQVVQERGTNFTPDAAFISSFPFPEKQTILRTVKPRAFHIPSPDRDQAFELLRKAYDAQRNRQFASAGESYQQALQLASDSATLHLAYAADLLLSHNYAPSDEQCRLSLKLWSEDAEAHAMLALSMTLQKRFPEAELESREALRIFPQHISATVTLAQSLTNQHKYKEAIPVVRQAIAVWPSMAALTKFLGIALMETGDTAAGTEQLSSYVKRAPDDAEGHYYLGVALRVKGSLDGAHAQFLEALRLQPNNPQYEAAVHPDAAPSATRPVLGPKPDDGSVSENIYTNRFFSFTYEFPFGWTVLSSDASRSLVEVGGALLSTGDPTEAETKKVAAQVGYPLLTLMQRRTKNQIMAVSIIQIVAIDAHEAPDMDPGSFMVAIADRLKQSGAGFELLDTPKKVTIAGRDFANSHHATHMANGQLYTSQFITKEKHFLLMINLSAPDQASLPALENSLNSLHFLQNPE